MIRDFLSGAGYVARGFSLLKQPGLRRFIAIPLLINTLLFAVASWWAWGLVEKYVLGGLPGWLEWLAWILIPIFSVAILVAVFYTFTLVANLIGAPFNAILAEKVEQLLDGKPIQQKSNISSMASDAVKSIFSELRKLLYLLTYSIPLLILIFIPGVNAFVPFLWLAFSAWMMSLEYMDCPMGNHGFTFKQQRKLLKKNRWLAWGFGSVVLLMTLIPIVNFFAMPVGVIGATVLWVEKLRTNNGIDDL